MTTLQLLPTLQKRDAFVLPQVSWEQYEAIDHAFSTIPGVKFRYLDQRLEIMPVSPEHEDFKAIIRRLLEVYLDAMNIRFYSRGGPSLGDKELGTVNEPDESYNLGTRKSHPDLVIEVVISSGGLDKLEGYRRLGVSEIWFWEDGVLDIYVLKDGGYLKQRQSQLLPDFPLEAFCRYITYHDQYDAVREFRQQVAGAGHSE